jgi:hypothetical protein
LHQGSRGSKILPVDAIAEKLDTKLSNWKPEISKEVRALVSDVIDAADSDALDLLRSRAVEQEVLDQLDEPHVPVKWGWLISGWPQRLAR